MTQTVTYYEKLITADTDLFYIYVTAELEVKNSPVCPSVQDITVCQVSVRLSVCRESVCDESVSVRGHLRRKRATALCC